MRGYAIWGCCEASDTAARRGVVARRRRSRRRRPHGCITMHGVARAQTRPASNAVNRAAASFTDALLRNRPSLPGAACVGRSHLFDWEIDDCDETSAQRAQRHNLAAEICHTCPVLEQCRDWAPGPTACHLGVVAGYRYRSIGANPTRVDLLSDLA
ncbi:MAG: hypothetical protein GEV09_15550 [Pseudonocardiaceae bacterium]|nr:hypothetical protein [Pseudonocardiaceae bacterium]